MKEMEAMLQAATWQTPDNPNVSRGLFLVTHYQDRIEVLVRGAGDLTSKSDVTIGDWTGSLSKILINAAPRTAVAGGPGLFAIEGLQFKRGSTPTGGTLLDIMPSIFEAMSIELSQELPESP